MQTKCRNRDATAKSEILESAGEVGGRMSEKGRHARTHRHTLYLSLSHTHTRAYTRTQRCRVARLTKIMTPCSCSESGHADDACGSNSGTHLHTLTHTDTLHTCRRGTEVVSSRVLKDTAGGTLTEQESMSGPRLPVCLPDDTRATQHARLHVGALSFLANANRRPLLLGTDVFIDEE